MRISIALATFLLLAAPTFGAEATDCDNIAAHPLDPDKTAEGLYLDSMDGPAAEAACREAIAQSPNEPRLLYELARALDQQDKKPEAEATYKQAMDAGYRMATYSYAAFLQDQGTDAAYQQAAQLYRKALDSGLSFAAGDLGYLYEAGLGVAADSEMAIALYKQAGEAGDAWSLNHVGAIYADGIGIAKDDAEAIKWYRAAADLGFAPAQNNLGNFYLNGRAVPKDEKEGARLIKLAAEQDDPQSLRTLAGLYVHGVGVERDPAEAERLLRHDLEVAGDVELWEAQNSLAWLLVQQNRNLDEAQGLAEAALAAAPPAHDDYDNLQDTLAWILHLKGDDARAKSLQAEAVAADPTNPMGHDHLGDIFKGLGDMEGARAEWRKALDLPDRPDDTDLIDRAAVQAKLDAAA